MFFFVGAVAMQPSALKEQQGGSTRSGRKVLKWQQGAKNIADMTVPEHLDRYLHSLLDWNFYIFVNLARDFGYC